MITFNVVEQDHIGLGCIHDLRKQQGQLYRLLTLGEIEHTSRDLKIIL